MSFYKMRILTKDKVHSFKVKQISLYDWDNIVKVNELYSMSVLVKNLDILKKITDLMIEPGFLTKFYAILNENREYAYYYKNHLVPTLYGIQYNVYQVDPDFKKPYLLFIDGYINEVGDYTQFDYINDNEWTYEKVIQSLEALV